MIGASGRQVRNGSTRNKKVWPGQPLTERELEVLARLCDRDEPTVRAAAADLHLSPETVSLHMTRIYRKLGVRTRLGAYRVVVEDLDTRLVWKRL